MGGGKFFSVAQTKQASTKIMNKKTLKVKKKPLLVLVDRW